MPQHCENDKLPWLKGRIFLSKAKCCLTLHRSCRFSLEYLQLYQFSHVWKSTGGPHLAWISTCFLIKYSEGIEVMVGTTKVLYWFAISSFTKSNLMCIFHIQIYFSYSLINSFMYSCKFWWPYVALTVCVGLWVADLGKWQILNITLI